MLYAIRDILRKALGDSISDTILFIIQAVAGILAATLLLDALGIVVDIPFAPEVVGDQVVAMLGLLAIALPNLVGNPDGE